MKYSVPEISWHNRDPVLSVDFQPKSSPNDPTRLATGGTDSHVLIWYISTSESGSVNLEVAADLTRHQKAVNVVRWSPSGEYLASGDDESIIFIWKKTDKEPIPTAEGEEQNKESWTIHKTLRGHMEDVLDITWSPDSLHLASGSVDNKLLLWDVTKGRYSAILTDHKGFVQGVAWDPRGQYIVSASSDRIFRTFDISTKKVVSRSSKTVLRLPKEHPLHDVKVRLYHDDTLQTYYRRLAFSPDGMLIAVPAGKIEPEQGKMEGKPINAVYIYTRYSLKVPVGVVPCEAPALACRWSPKRYGARPGLGAAALPSSRFLLAVATRRSVLLYHTQQHCPLALLTNIHYTRLTDLSWSNDGRTLVASSTDGFCSVLMFQDGELGETLEDVPAVEPEPMETDTCEEIIKEEEKKKQEDNKKQADKINKINTFIKFKSPSEISSPKVHTNETKTPIKIDVLEEVAMPSWSDDSNNEIIKPKEDPGTIIIEDSEDIKLVYEETQGTNENKDKDDNKNKAKDDSNKSKSPEQLNAFFKRAKVTDVKEPAKDVIPSPPPKATRRVNFITLSSPKNSKKKC